MPMRARCARYSHTAVTVPLTGQRKQRQHGRQVVLNPPRIVLRAGTRDLSLPHYFLRTFYAVSGTDLALSAVPDGCSL